VRAPCVLTQWPQQDCDYGPDEQWEECFLIYDAARCQDIREMRLYDPERPMWSVADAGPLRQGVAELRRLLALRPLERVVDRIDRCAENLIVASLLAAEADDPSLAAVARCRDLIEADIWRDHDWDLLATEAGLSRTHFRRLWLRLVGCPPQRYIMRLRLEHACRLLAESRRSIQEIAAVTGFDDPLYFSRRFRALVGIAPSDYRRQSHRHLDIVSRSSTG
ncbi:MAG: helix-turn-helix domain-containing protein, partial [Planctomycetota bacterium]